MGSLMDAYADLIGKTLHVVNADHDFLNLVEPSTGNRYWVESTGHLLVFAREPEQLKACECLDGGHDVGTGVCMCGGRISGKPIPKTDGRSTPPS